MAGNFYTESEAIAAGLYDAPGSPGASALADANKRLTGGGGSDLFTTNSAAPSDSSAVPSPGQSKFNGWANYLTGQITGLPSGNATGPGGTNPGASASPAASAFTGLIPRIAIVILGFIFVAVGLTLFGVNNPAQDIVKRVIK